VIWRWFQRLSKVTSADVEIKHTTLVT